MSVSCVADVKEPPDAPGRDAVRRLFNSGTATACGCAPLAISNRVQKACTVLAVSSFLRFAGSTLLGAGAEQLAPHVTHDEIIMLRASSALRLWRRLARGCM